MNGVAHTPYLHSLAVFFRNWLSLVEHRIFNLKVVGSSPTFLIGSCQLDYSHDLWCLLLNSLSGQFFSIGYHFVSWYDIGKGVKILNSEMTDFFKMQIEHANFVSDSMIAIAGIMLTLSVFVVTYQLVLNKKTIDTLKKDNQKLVKDITKYTFIMGIRNQAETSSRLENVKDTVEYFNKYFSNDLDVFDEMKKYTLQILRNELSSYSAYPNITPENNHDEINKLFEKEFDEKESKFKGDVKTEAMIKDTREIINLLKDFY